MSTLADSYHYAMLGRFRAASNMHDSSAYSQSHSIGANG
jgi:hypothetical protein